MSENKTTSIAEYSKTESALAELREKYSRKYDVTTTKGMTEAREARAEIKKYRTDLEKKRVEIKAPALEHCRLIDAEAKRISAELEALEGPIDETIKAEETRKEREKLQAEQAAQAEAAAALGLCNEMRASLTAMVGRSSAEVADQVVAINAVKVPDNKHASDVISVKEQVASQLEALRARAVAQEEDDKKRIEERAELERLRAAAAKAEAESKARIEAEQKKADAERAAADIKAKAEREAADAAAAKVRAEAERVAREAREKEEAKLRAERAKLDAERDAAAALEQKRKDEAAATEKAKRDAAEAKARAAEDERVRKLTGRGLLEKFVSEYSKDPEFNGIAGTINAWLGANQEEPKAKKTKGAA